MKKNPRLAFAAVLLAILFGTNGRADDHTLVLNPPNGKPVKHAVLVAGDEEYRTEESMPMLGKILSQRHGFKCTVVFSWSVDGSYIDPNNQEGLRGLAALDTADVLIIGTRFRKPNEDEAKHITKFLDDGKPVIGIRTATHAFNGPQKFGGSLGYGEFGRKILGEQWVSHHGGHKRQGCRGVVEPANKTHPILNSVSDLFVPSDVYGVTHLTDKDQILMRAAVTETLNPNSKNIDGAKNDPMQPFAWLHDYVSPGGAAGKAFCTTGGASVDLLNEGLRRMVINAALHLTGIAVPQKTNVDFVDDFHPSFYGFIRDKNWWSSAKLTPATYQLGESPKRPDPNGTPEWKFIPASADANDGASLPLKLNKGTRIAAVGNSTAERMNLYGHFETLLHTRFPEKELIFRNFGWPADAVGNQQRPNSYTTIDDPMKVFSPEVLLCFFGFNESFDGPEGIEAFVQNYRNYIADTKNQFTKDGKAPTFVLISPIGFEATGHPLQPSGKQENANLKAYSKAIEKLAADDGHLYVNVLSETESLFNAEPGKQFTINGVHVNELGDAATSLVIDQQLFQTQHPIGTEASKFEAVRKWVNDKSWYHSQDYRMLNGWYVYGGRRTWDKETFPTEYRKIRNIVAVRDQYIWDLAAGKKVADDPDDSKTGEVFEPETMFGSRDENFRKMREPKELKFPTPEESIGMMSVPEGFEVQLFASEREFPELANPNQIAFDAKGRLWVSCMANYPQWQPGAAKPNDRLLIFEDTDQDGKADVCKTFYDKLICPTGFEFWNGGVLVVDEPRILFIKDTDGDDKADEVIELIDGIATDDTHHTVGAWEWSHGGYLHMLEGIALSTTMETPWGPFRNKNTGGAYVFDPHAQRFTHYRTPGYGNPWCLVFDQWGNGIVGDGTNAKQHWISPLAGKEVSQRKTLTPVFDNQGMRPAVGNEFLLSRHLPDDVQGQFIYACVINMHGLPRFNLRDQESEAGFEGERVADLLSSTDMIFRPVDPKVGPDGAVWFGDWCNPLIGHMQYSQRDPNRDHKHGRMYRLVNKNKPLLKTITLHDKSEGELLELLSVYELRTRYRVRRELRDRDKAKVFAAISSWTKGTSDPMKLCEAMWIQESFRDVDEELVDRIMQTDAYQARAAAVHTVTNLRDHVADIKAHLANAIADPHPRVRLEAVRGLSFIDSADAVEMIMKVVDQPTDYWIEYTLEHALHALKSHWESADANVLLANSTDAAKKYLDLHKKMSGPGGEAVKPLKIAEDVDASRDDRMKAVRAIAKMRGGNAGRGAAVFKQVCSACHLVGDIGKKFGPELSDVGSRLKKEELLASILMPNDKISKGYETVQVLTEDGEKHVGFILKETAKVLSLGIAKGKQVDIKKDEIEIRQPMKASSMPEGLITQIAPIEFLDLVAYLEQQRDVAAVRKDGWITLRTKARPKLRKHGNFAEISRDASIQLGKTMTNGSWHRETHLFLSDQPKGEMGFVFHSEHDAIDPSIVVRLKKESEIRHIWLQNRVEDQFYKRAKGLAIWTSVDGKKFTKVWEATKTPKEWHIDLPAGTRAKYIRIGISGKGTFHLNRGAVYGVQ